MHSAVRIVSCSGFDLERSVDDFVCMCFFVGNDFLPHLPTLDISEHAFDTLFDAYKTLFQEDPGYLVSQGSIGDLRRLERFFELVGAKEEEILVARDNDIRQFSAKARKHAAHLPLLGLCVCRSCSILAHFPLQNKTTNIPTNRLDG